MYATQYPGATYRWLPSDTGGFIDSDPKTPGQQSLGCILHVNAGNGDPYNWWVRPEVKASSHFQVMKSGEIIQYVPLNRIAWTQVAGNPYWHSMETEGWPSEPLNQNQLESCARIYAFGHKEWGWRLQLSESPWAPGFGTHEMGGAAWGGHACPGKYRASQRADILRRAQSILGSNITPSTNRFSRFGILTLGSEGYQVGILQKYLKVLAGANLNIDGDFGPRTREAVLNFQRYFGLKQDGIVGPNTWAVLDYIADLWEVNNEKRVG